ncbi:MAG: ATP-binding protein [Candidatus Dadabacteria bacterium]|nr:MAG: ATP-binding protein [Candidatus Dadabacteria bacterium]
MYKRRYLKPQIKKDLARKMVFVGGPRQVGKTTLARDIISDPRSYLNWDIPEHRDKILKNLLPNVKAWVFDEIHKYGKWRNFLKGLFDQYGKDKQILVTGSARLDYYRRGGDSLQGRYHYLRLLPFTVKELQITSQKDLTDLLTLGPFPEQFLSGSLKESKRWSLEYRSRLVNEDIRDLERVQDISMLELLAARLPELVGSPLSINALREDLSVSHKTVDRWVQILERMYFIFRIAPFINPHIKAVKKEQKHYHFDYTQVKDEGSRFENFIALHLLKWCFYQYDCNGENYQLRYYRDSQAREVDFVVIHDDRPVLFVEAKLSAKTPSKHLIYLKSKFPDVPAYQLVKKEDQNFIDKHGIIVQSALIFLQNYI